MTYRKSETIKSNKYEMMLRTFVKCNNMLRPMYNEVTVITDFKVNKDFINM